MADIFLVRDLLWERDLCLRYIFVWLNRSKPYKSGALGEIVIGDCDRDFINWELFTHWEFTYKQSWFITVVITLHLVYWLHWILKQLWYTFISRGFTILHIDTLRVLLTHNRNLHYFVYSYLLIQILFRAWYTVFGTIVIIYSGIWNWTFEFICFVSRKHFTDFIKNKFQFWIFVCTHSCVL